MMLTDDMARTIEMALLMFKGEWQRTNKSGEERMAALDKIEAAQRWLYKEPTTAIAALEAPASEVGQEWVPVDVVELVSGREVRCDDVGLYIGTGDKLHNALAWPETGKYRLCQRTHAPAPEPLVMPPDVRLPDWVFYSGQTPPLLGDTFVVTKITPDVLELETGYRVTCVTLEQQRRPAAGGDTAR